MLANNNLSSVSEATFTSQFNKALQKGSDAGVFDRPKGKLSFCLFLGRFKERKQYTPVLFDANHAIGTSGPVKLAKSGETKKSSSPVATKKTETKAAPKATATKKAPADKKVCGIES